MVIWLTAVRLPFINGLECDSIPSYLCSSLSLRSFVLIAYQNNTYPLWFPSFLFYGLPLLCITVLPFTWILSLLCMKPKNFPPNLHLWFLFFSFWLIPPEHAWHGSSLHCKPRLLPLSVVNVAGARLMAAALSWWIRRMAWSCFSKIPVTSSYWCTPCPTAVPLTAW